MTANARPRAAGQLPLWGAPAAPLRRTAPPDRDAPTSRGRIGRDRTVAVAATGDARPPRAPRRSRLDRCDRSPVPRPTARELAAGQTIKGPVRERHEADPWLLIATVALSAVGVLMIYSTAAASLSSKTLRHHQGHHAGADLGDAGHRRHAGPVAHGLPLAATHLGALLPGRRGAAGHRPGPGHRTHLAQGGGWFGALAGHPGARNPHISFHPAEIAKLALVIYLAHWLARRGTTVSNLFTGTVPFLVIAGCVIALVALEPDLGTTGVITLTAFMMFFVAGASLWQLALLVPGRHRGGGDVYPGHPVPARPLEHVPRPVPQRTRTRPTTRSRVCTHWASAGCSGRAWATAVSRAA